MLLVFITSVRIQNIVKDSSLLPEGGTSFSPSTDEGGDKLNNDGGSDLIVKDKFVG